MPRLIQKVLLCLFVFSIASVALADRNLLQNPDAEKVVDGKLPGFGLFLEEGAATLAPSDESPHSGNWAARLTLSEWKADPNRIKTFLILGDSDGKSSGQVAELLEGTLLFSYNFWARGTVGRTTIEAWGWDADGKRVKIPGPIEIVHLTDKWQQISGRIKLPEGIKKLALGLGVWKGEKAGAKLGWLEVDDAGLFASAFPDSELRAIWWHHNGPTDREGGVKEIERQLDRFERLGINSVFYWTSSLYIATTLGMEGADDPRAKWDSLGEVIERAAARGMEVHCWYSPWIYKEKNRAIELRQHPEWASRDRDGKEYGKGLCLARADVRQFELDMVKAVCERYPKLAGIHIEEPGYSWKVCQCHCDHCRKTLSEIFGESDPFANVERLKHWAAFASTDFMVKTRAYLLEAYPHMFFSTNGSAGKNTDWAIGRDWLRWARFGYIDFFVPQVYTMGTATFRTRLGNTQNEITKYIPVIPVIGITWSSAKGKHNPIKTVEAEIGISREMGVRGFGFFEANHFTEEEIDALGPVVKKK
jgi:uncharacterized lipoprotein YddW (UPF0748 family)